MHDHTTCCSNHCSSCNQCSCHCACERCPRVTLFTNCNKKCSALLTHLSSTHFDLESGLVYTVTKRPSTYKKAVASCRNLEDGYRIATVNEVVRLCHLFTYFDAHVRVKTCPVLVWATQNSKPVQVYVAAAIEGPIKVIQNPSLSCRAYTLCVVGHSC